MSDEIVTYIYPDDKDIATHGRVSFGIPGECDPIVGRYCLMNTEELHHDFPHGIQQQPAYVFLPLGIILYSLKGSGALSTQKITALAHCFINEAQRDFPAIWQHLCQIAKQEAIGTL